MWAKIESGSVSKIFTKPTQLKIGDINYPRNIFELWAESDLKTLGIYPVVQDNSNLKDSEYYINGNSSNSFADDTVTLSYASATAKPKPDPVPVTVPIL